jgi:hypothetical protein
VVDVLENAECTLLNFMLTTSTDTVCPRVPSDRFSLCEGDYLIHFPEVPYTYFTVYEQALHTRRQSPLPVQQHHSQRLRRPIDASQQCQQAQR